MTLEALAGDRRASGIPVATMDLVIQAPAIGAKDLTTITELAGAEGIRVVDGGAQQAYRLPRIHARAGVSEFCAAAGIDWAFLASDLTLDRVRVVALDMDSTLITIECVDEIADRMGIKPEVASITAAAMRGEIDFRESLVRRVALLAGLPVDALAQVYDERVVLSPGAERMLAGFHAAGAKTLLVSGGFTFFTERLKTRLELDAATSNTLEVDQGRLTGRLLPPIVDAQGKAQHLAAMRRQYAGTGGIVVAIGDGANDLPMLKAADVSIAYRAKPLVRAQATCAINHCGLDAALNLFV